MGNMFKETYEDDIRKPLSDWLNNNVVGRSVTNLPLSLANRAQKTLWGMKEWQRLIKEVSLTITNNSATLPADFGREVAIGSDVSGSGYIDTPFCKDGEVGRGYKITASFSKASGNILSITFFTPYDNGSAIYLRYIPILEDFTASGTEYSYFPANLVLLMAHKIYTLEEGKVQEYQAVNQRFEEEFSRYCNLVQNNNTSFDGGRLRDRYGNDLSPTPYGLDGMGRASGNNNYYPNSKRP